MENKGKSKQELLEEIEKLKQELDYFKSKNEKVFPGLSVIQKFEKKLTHQKEINDKLLEITDFGIWELDVETRFFKCNKVFFEIFKLPYKEEIYEKEVLERFFRKDLLHIEAEFINLSKNSNKNIEIEVRLDIENENKWILLKAIYYENNGFKKFIGYVSDVSLKYQYKKDLSKSEEAKKESENKFKILGDSIPIGIFYANTIGEIVYHNHIILQKSQRKFEEISNFKWIKFIHPEDKKKVEEDLKKALKEKKSFFSIFRFIRGDGKIIWIDYNAEAYFEKNTFAGWFGIIRDITEKKNDEIALIESEQKLENILSNFKGMIYKVKNNKDWTTLYVSKGSKKLTGYTQEEIFEKNYFSKFIVEEDKNKVREIVDKAIKNKKPYFLEYRLKHKNGDLLWVQEQGQGVENDKGKIDFLEGFIYDISTSKLNEDKLKASEEKYRNLIEKIQEEYFFYTHDVNGNFTYLSSSFEKILGYKTSDYLVNVTMHPFTNNPINKDAIEYTKKSVIGIKSPIYEIELYHKNKSKVNLEILETPIFNSNNEVVRVEGIAKDITVKKKYEQELKNNSENFKRLIESSPIGMAIVQDEKIIYANETALNISGHETLDKIINVSIWDLIPFKYKDLIKQRFQKAFETQERQEFLEISVINKFGQEIKVETSPMPMLYDGKLSMQIVIQDISDRKKLQKELIKSEIAEETNKLLQVEISNRLLTEKKLLEATSFSNSIIDCSLDMIIAVDNEGKIVEFNDAAKNIFGYSDDELLKIDIEDLYKSKAELVEVINLVKKQGNFIGEVDNKRKNGQIFKAFISASQLINDKGETFGFMTVSRDITKEKEAEEILKTSENRFAALFMQAPFSIEIFDAKGYHVKVNKQFESIFEFTINDSKKNKYNVHLDKELRDIGIYPYFKKGFEGESSFIPATKTYIKKGNKEKEIWLSRFVYPIINNQKITEVIVIHINETEKKIRERKLQEQTAKINAIIENSSHKIWTLNKNFELTSFNKNFYHLMKKLLGIKIYNGLNIKTITKKATKQEFFETITSVYKNAFNNNSEYFEAPFLDLEKNKIWLEIYLSPIILENGEIEEISCIAQDITEKKQSEYKLKASLNEKEVLLKEVHHRVKNNLQVISSILNLQTAYVKDKNTLNIIKESQNRVKTMAFIHQTLYQTEDFSKINFSNYIQNLTKNLVHSYRITNKKIDVKFNIQKGIFLDLDFAIPCGLIINELISNALKYAFSDDVIKKGIITVTLKNTENNILLSVKDNGKGLPEKFDINNTNSLGLQLVSSLIGQLNAKFDIHSEENKITEFKLQFSTLSE